MTRSPSDRIASFVGRPKSKRTQTVRKKKRSALEIAEEAAKSRSSTGDWEGASGKDLVGLYAFCHHSVYGVSPLELREASQFKAASRAAAKLVRTDFAGDYGAAVDFIRWTWIRERGREKWARDNDKQRGRLGWRLAFSTKIVTDYRVEMTRRSRRG